MAQQAAVGLPASTQGQQPQLTPRQWEILRLVAMGYTNRQIARRTSVAEGTVRKHLQNIFEQLKVSSRTAAVTSAFRATHPPHAAAVITVGPGERGDRGPEGLPATTAAR